MRKYLLHVIIISFVFILTPTIQAASYLEEQIEAYKQAISIDPDDANAHYGLGVAYFNSGMDKEAIESYKKAIRIDPDYADAIFGAWRWDSNVQLREGYDLRFHQNNPDELQFILVTEDSGGNRTQQIAQKNLSNSVGSWIHVVGTYNKTTGEQKLYVDGQLVDTENHPVSNTIAPLTSYPDMRIGHSRVDRGFFDSTIEPTHKLRKKRSMQKIICVRFQVCAQRIEKKLHIANNGDKL